ncbi:efflux transporter outer membrane subunit [Ferrigenium sp. UT5]|uniref:efflux transporter outer membrane subunit n=1 Tax=Ferrigenium sp. UT5 TaxID=3242105 RepID=UPI00354D75E7
MTSLLKYPISRTLLLTGLALVNAACTVGPDYVRPPLNLPPAYKEHTFSQPGALRAVPAEGRWWKIYNDRELDGLLEQIEMQNPSLQAAEARVRQARALTGLARSQQVPTVTAGGTNDLGLIANWEIDLWGRIRRTIEANGASAEASAADFAAAKLSFQAQLAQDYFLLRARDAEIHLLQDLLALHTRGVQIVHNQYAAGILDRSQVSQAQAQLGNTQVKLQDARLARAQLEHAIALLVGKAPADFSLTETALAAEVPELPPTLPAELLQRRPDIQATERRMAAASAQIGAAEATGYPSLNLFAGVSIGKGLLGGAEVAAPVYAGEAPQARRMQASAAYDEAVANYRQTVFNALREVEDNLAAQRILETAAGAQHDAVSAVREAARISDNQYQAGILDFLAVVDVHTSATESERVALDLLSRRLVTSVTLIKALGGSWLDTTGETHQAP